MDDQLDRISAQAQHIPLEDDGESPLMPFPTNYVLNRTQEAELINHAFDRLQQLESELGRDIAGAGDWWMNDTAATGEYRDPEGGVPTERTFLGKRRLYDLVSQNNVEHRAYILGGIFAESNLVVPIARKIARQMVARAVNYFFGTDPWFSIYPVGAADRIRADKADRYTRWKMDQAKLKRSQEQAIERAFTLGEAVVKTTWANREQYYKTTATVLVDEAGADILGLDGDFILETDLWIQQVIQDPMTGEQMMGNVMVLKRDGQTPQPQNMIWQEKPITRRITQYKGPEAKTIHYLDFLCPLDAEDVQTADCVVHLYDQAVMDLADQWRKQTEQSATAMQHYGDVQKAINLISELAHSTPEPESGQNTADSNMGSGSAFNRGDRTAPLAKIAEFHLRYDADGDGLLEDIMLIVDRKTRTPIFYDYVANVTPDGLRPFSVTRVNEVPGRWYGIGTMEMFESSQQIVDLLVNRWNFAQSRAARVDFWNPHNTLEGRANSGLALNWGGTYTPLPGKSAKDCLESVYLENNTKDNIKELTEFFLQLMVTESGVNNANDGQAVGMDSQKLATGIRNIEKSGQELFSLYLGHLEPGVSGTLQKMVRLLFANLDKMEVYRYFEEGEGGEGAEEMLQIDPGEIADMEIDTRILLTRYRGEQILESSVRAVELVERFYAMAPEIQERTQKLFQDMLKALQVSAVDEIIQPTVIQAPPAGMPNATQVAQAAKPKPRQGAPNL
jgi:hypothetical protein